MNRAEMNDDLKRIYDKSLNEMNEIELAIWFTSEGTTAYDMNEAARKYFMKKDLTKEYFLAWKNETEKNKRLQRLALVAQKLVSVLPVSEIDLAREVWGNMNTRITKEARSELAAALKELEQK